ncbi:MAG TPA: lysophospholipid acyltransferase family protein [Longimicrobiales bacterium]
MILYPLFQRIVRTGWRFIGPVELVGLENVPEQGPVLVIANHQSILDPILIQSFCPRPMHTMAKSTQYGSRVMGWLLPRLLAFPVRRYQVDPQSVRSVLRHLEQGHAVGIYVEGERSWDGKLQRPRLGTVRLLLKAGVPIVPVGISGSYDVLPRWDHGLRRAPVRIAFGEPLRWPRLDRREERERALPGAAAELMRAIERLLEPPGR